MTKKNKVITFQRKYSISISEKMRDRLLIEADFILTYNQDIALCITAMSKHPFFRCL